MNDLMLRLQCYAIMLILNACQKYIEPSNTGKTQILLVRKLQLGNLNWIVAEIVA